MNTRVKKIVAAALMAALACAATMVIKIPSPLNGYLNLGDCIVLMAGWMLTPAYGFLAAGLGSGLADLLSGYAVYAPATFIIKGIMALMAFYCFNRMHKTLGGIASMIIGGIAAEAFMVLGYFIFEGFMYGFAPSIVNIPANCVQGTVGLIAGIVLIKLFNRINIHSN